MRRILIALALAAAPTWAAADDHLSEALSNYVAAVNMDELDADAKARLRAILDAPDLDHVDRVVEIHSVLETNDALAHVNVHGEAPSQRLFTAGLSRLWP